jgi:hypothetical protein
MKKLLALVLIVGVGGAAAYGWFLQSVHHVLIELKQGVETPNLAQVDPYVDYERVGSSLLDYSQARAELAAEEAAGGIGKGIMGGLANLFRSVGEERAKRNLKDDIRATIAEGKFREIAQEFSPADGLAALASIDTLEDGTKRVTFKGECEGGPATVPIDFVRTEGGRYGLGTYKCIGLSKVNAKALATTCHEHAKKNRK